MNMIIAMAEHAPLPALIMAMEQLCAEYRKTPTDENAKHVIVLCEIIAIKNAAKDLEGFEKLQKEIEKNKKAIEFFTPKEN